MAGCKTSCFSPIQSNGSLFFFPAHKSKRRSQFLFENAARCLVGNTMCYKADGVGTGVLDVVAVLFPPPAKEG